jgi:hypothetical protein
MSNSDRSPAEIALTDSITTMTDFGTQANKRASRLGKALWRNIDLVNANPTLWNASVENQKTTGTVSGVCRITPFCIGWLLISVPKTYRQLEGTDEWLKHACQADLNLQRSKTEVPPGISKGLDAKDIQSETEITLEPASNIDDARPRRDRLYKATFEAGIPLQVPEVGLVITILDQMAGGDSAF